VPFRSVGFLVAAALAIAGCGVAREEFDKRTNELDRCQSELTRTRTESASARTERDDASARLDKANEKNQQLEREKQQLGSDTQAIKNELEELRRQRVLAEQRADVYRSLVSKLRSMIDAGTLAVAIRKGKMLVKLGDQILFDPGKADLTAGGQAALRQVAAVLREIPDRDFVVAGHTDNQPIKNSAYRSNWELSTARAVTVVRFLQSEGVDPRHLAAAGYSEFDSVARNDTNEERALNRRIEIVVMPNLDELPAIEPLANAPAPAAAATPAGAAAPEPAAPAAPPPPPPAPLLR
jgi:chemotaxis protein MotB